MVQGELEAGGGWLRAALQLKQHFRRWWLVVGLLLVLVPLVALLAIKPLIIASARRAAAERGLLLAVERVSLGWRSVTLENVGVTLRDVDVVRGDLHRVRVALGWDLSPREVSASGGEVVVSGNLTRVQEQLGRWQRERPRTSAGAESGAGLALSSSDLRLLWTEPGTDEHPLELVGVSYARPDVGPERVEFQSLLAKLAGVELTVTDARLVLSREQGQRRLSELRAESLNTTLELDKLSWPGDPGANDIATADANQSEGAKSRGERLAGLLPALDPERGTGLRAAVSKLAELARAKLPVSASVDLGKLNVTLVHEQQKLHLGPNRFRLERHADRAELSLQPGSQHRASPLALKVSVPFDQGPLRMSVSGGPVSLASLGVKEGDFSLREVARSQLALNGELALTQNGQLLDVVSDGSLAPLSFHNASLSEELLRGTTLGWNGKAQLRLDGSAYHIDRWQMRLGEVELGLSGTIEKRPSGMKARISGGIPLASCQALLDSAPEGLLPLLKGVKLAGTFALDAAVSFDTDDLANMAVKWDFRNECRITEVPLGLAPRRFLNVFRMQVKDATGRIVSVETGPGTLGWTPYAGISPNMETAVLICEDGRFFRHQGFDREAIENSIRENVKAGRFVRGASTISMQLAKNLYLSFDKTLSRKLQEAMLTTLLEQELSKEEMMELYLNVIEYGPGIYGIAAAAKHYFNSTPHQLSLGQALYLASILPNPAQQHFTESGVLSERWHDYLQRLMRIAVKIRRISDAEYEAALNEEIRLGEPSAPSEGGMFLPSGPPSDEANFGDWEGDLPQPTP